MDSLPGIVYKNNIAAANSLVKSNDKSLRAEGRKILNRYAHAERLKTLERSRSVRQGR